VSLNLTYQPFKFTAEIYGNGHNESFYKSGFKYMAYKNRMQFNASYGNQLAYIKEDSYFFCRAVLSMQDYFDP